MDRYALELIGPWTAEDEVYLREQLQEILAEDGYHLLTCRYSIERYVVPYKATFFAQGENRQTVAYGIEAFVENIKNCL